MTDLDERISKLQAQLKAKQIAWDKRRKVLGISPQERMATVRELNALMDRLDVLLRERDAHTEPPY